MQSSYNKNRTPFQGLARSLLQDESEKNVVTLKMLDQFKNPSFNFEIQSSDRMARQIEKQNQLILQLQQKLLQKEEEDQQYLQGNRYNKMQTQYQPEYSYQQIMPPLPPPPIFLPQNYSFMQRQEQDKQQQEKLRLLLLMKKLREENFLLRMKLESNQGAKEQSSYSKSSNSQSSKEYKQVPRPKQGPDRSELDREIAEMNYLISKRAQAQLQLRTRRLILMLKFIRRTKMSVKMKIDKFVGEFPEKIVEFQNNLFQWMSFTEPITQQLKTQKNLILNTDPKTSSGEAKKRTEELKKYVKHYIEALLDNMETFPEYCRNYLVYFTHNFYATPPNYLLKFVVNRMLFTTSGGTVMDSRKGQMMLLTMVWIRYYLFYLLYIWQPTPPQAKSAEAKINQQLQLNLHTIVSVIYELLIEFLRGFVAVQPNNQKLLPVENQPTLKSGGIYRIPNYPERESDKILLQNLRENDEPLIYPALGRADSKTLFAERQYLESMKAYFEGWAEQTYQVVDDYKRKEADRLIQNFNSNELGQITRMASVVHGTKMAQQVRQINNQINEQRAKIKQIKNFLNISVSKSNVSKRSQHSQQL